MFSFKRFRVKRIQSYKKYFKGFFKIIFKEEDKETEK